MYHGLYRDSNGPGRRRINQYCLVYTLAGETEYEDELIGKHRLRPGDLLLLHPGVQHSYGNGPAGGWDEYFLVFEGPIFDLWAKKGLLDPYKPIVHLEPIPYWHHRLALCVEGKTELGLAANIKQIVNLLSFLAEALETHLAPGPNIPRPWLAQACGRLESDLSQTLEWKAFSRSLGVAPDTFRKIFTRAMGMSPSRYRTAKIIDRACELSSHHHMLAKEIARELGFATEQHFSRRFKQVMGINFSQFRKQWTPEENGIGQNG